MVRLSDIPPNILEEIQRFVREQKGKVPVTSSPKEDGSKIETLPDLVEKRFGYRLSPSQIYTLQKGERTYRVKLDVEAIRELEERFGSVAKGVKQILRFYGAQQLPPHLKEPHKVLLEKGEVSSAEVEELLLPFVEESREVWRIIGELSRLGYVSRQGDRYIVHRFRRDPLAELFFR